MLRLYPSRWRAEYGDELAELLSHRPLGLRAILNVVANALWQQIRMQEPWRIAAVPLLAWVLAFLTVAFVSPDLTSRIGDKPAIIGVVLFFGTGFWTVRRGGKGGAIAAAKLSLVVALPFVIFGMILLTRIALGAPVSGNLPPNVGHFGPDSLVAGPVLQLPYAALLGWLGDLTARGAQRIRRSRATR